MRNLFALLWKYHFFVLFLVLEIISLFFLFNSYSYHRSLKYSVVSDFSGSMFSTYSSITNYFSLKNENEILAAENARFRNLSASSFYHPDSTNDIRDSLYHFISAKIVSTSVNKPNNFMLINKGEKAGLEKEMGVISSNGIAGIVIGTSDNYSIVMSMLHQNIRISGRIKNSGQLVNLVWPGNDYTVCKVIDIPSHIILQKGDTVVTSGNSLIFPEGIVIGTIEEQEQNASEELSQARLKFSTDFNRLKHIYVIQNKKKKEQLDLIDSISDE